jgi:hypothetical protein
VFICDSFPYMNDLELEQAADYRVVELCGSGADIGAQMAQVLQRVPSPFRKWPWEEDHDFLEACATMLEDVAPWLWEELATFAEGIGLPAEQGLFVRGGSLPHGCSAVAWRAPDGRVLAGRTYDFYTRMRTRHLLVTQPVEGYRHVGMNGGLVGGRYDGVNEHGVFVALQARLRQPLMRLGIFTVPNLAAANIAQLLLGAAWIPMFLFLNLYLQQILGLGAFASGAALLPLTVTIMVGMIAAAPKLIARFGPKAMTVTGLGTLAVGLLWLSRIDAHGSFLADVLPASLVAAAGMAMAFIPSLGTALSSAAPEEGGLAAGIVNTSYQFGSALGLAAMTAVAAASGADQVGDPVALTSGFSAALLGAAGIAAVGAALAAVLLKRAPAAPEPHTDDERIAA